MRDSPEGGVGNLIAMLATVAVVVAVMAAMIRWGGGGERLVTHAPAQASLAMTPTSRGAG
ncbi:MAG TPA: hypothetical protein VGL58_14570 [Caulobacteraceae bacterium]|jgi:FlaG/FlaF family flagellin (archaellin)